MTTWRVLAKEGERKLFLSGPEGQHAFEVYRGELGRVVWTALKSLQAPVLRRRIPDGFKVKCPDLHLGRPNTGDNRRLLLLCPPKGAPVVLKLVRQSERLEKPFVLALRDAIERKIDPGSTIQKLSEGASGSDGWGAIGGRKSPKRKEQAA